MFLSVFAFVPNANIRREQLNVTDRRDADICGSRSPFGFKALLELKRTQAHGVRDHGNGAERHRKRAYDRTEKDAEVWVEDAGGNRDTDRVVGCLCHPVPPDEALYPPAEGRVPLNLPSGCSLAHLSVLWRIGAIPTNDQRNRISFGIASWPTQITASWRACVPSSRAVSRSIPSPK
jgi:hypothetical protein